MFLIVAYFLDHPEIMSFLVVGFQYCLFDWYRGLGLHLGLLWERFQLPVGVWEWDESQP